MADLNRLPIISFPSSLVIRQFKLCLFAFTSLFLLFTFFFIFSMPSNNLKTVWLENVIHNRTQFFSFFSHLNFNDTGYPQFSRKANGFFFNKTDMSKTDANGSSSNGNFSNGANLNGDLSYWNKSNGSNESNPNGFMNSTGNLTNGSTPNGNVSNGLKNFTGNLSNGSNPNENVSNEFKNSAGSLTNGSNPNGNVSNGFMNSTGNLTNGSTPNGNVSNELKNSAGSLTNGSNPNGNVSNELKNSTENLINWSNPNENVSNGSKNSTGNLSNESNSNVNISNELKNNSTGNLTNESISNGNESNVLKNSTGNVSNGSNPIGNVSNGLSNSALTNELNSSQNLSKVLNSSGSGDGVLTMGQERDEKWLEKMIKCNIFKGRWVKDNEAPFYKPGSCPYIDEDFDCFLNGRTENAYEKYRWQPDNCDIPRWNASEMLELLRGKRLVFVGDSLNRNMWESMICMLRDSVQNKTNVFEASGSIHLKTDGSYSFLFPDHNFSVEFFRTTFLVEEWQVPGTNGSTKETLRLDLFDGQSHKYKNADILIFNTGHWWTHEKTASGKGYYQEGDHIYDELNVFEALRRAMTTWAKWIETNVDTKKTLVFFRGYSASHFSGGKWNTGGTCDNETEPIYKEEYLQTHDYLPWLESIEGVIKEMKPPVYYLNVTRMSDWRKDAHPSIYRKQNLTDEERRMRIQDCAHWCLPGVPDTWNEIVYTQYLIRHLQRQQEEKLRQGQQKIT